MASQSFHDSCVSETLVDVLRRRAVEQPDGLSHTFLAHGDAGAARLTHAELDARARAIAAWLQDRFATGDRILVLCPSGPDAVAGFYGCLYAGMIPVPAEPSGPGVPRSPARPSALLTDSGARGVLTVSDVFDDGPVGGLTGAGTPTGETAAVPGPERLALDRLDEAAWGPRWRPAASPCAPVAQPMRFSLIYFPGRVPEFAEDGYRLLLEGAKFADQHDFEAVWLSERPSGGGHPNPSVLASALAVLTERIRLRAGGLVPSVSQARGLPDWAAVDGLSGGRVDLAFAAGPDSREFGPAPDGRTDRRASLASALDTARAFRGGRSADRYDGAGRDQPTPPFPQPGQSEPATVWVACSGGIEQFVEAGECGANVLTALQFQSVGELAEKIAAYRAARARSGRDPRSGHVTLMLHTFVGDDLDEVFSTVRGPLGSYLEASAELWQHGAGRLSDLDRTGRQQALSEAFERYVRSGALVGTPESCLPFVQRLRVAGVDEIAALVDFGIDTDVALDGLHALDLLRRHACGLPAAVEPAQGRRAGARSGPPGATAPTDPAEAALSAATAAPAGRQDAMEDYLRRRVAEALERTPGGSAPVRGPLGPGADGPMVLGLANAGRLDVRIALTPAEFAALGGDAAWAFEPPPPDAGGADGADRAGDGTSDLRRRVRQETFPLSPPQQRLWFLEKLTPGTSAYCLPMAARLSGPLDVAALERALNRVVARHEALRTAFVDHAGEASQVVTAQQGLTVPLVDLRDRPAGRREEEALELAAEFTGRPFDLARSPLLRATVLRLAPDDHLLVMVGHHIVIDGWAIGVLFDELAAGYQAALRGEDPALPELPLQYPDFTLWQRGAVQGPEMEKQLGYWKQKLTGAPALLELPTDRPRPAVQRFRGATRSFPIGAGLHEELRRLSREEGVTLFMTLLAAFNVLLARYSDQDDVVVGTPIANRNRPELQGLIGFFANTLALRTDLGGNPSFRELLDQVRETCLDAYVNQDVPFETVIDALEPTRDLSHQLVFQVMFALQGTVLSDLRLPGLDSTPVELDSGASRFDLSFSLSEAEDGLHCAVEYNTDLFDEATIERMAGHYRVLLESVAADPACPIGRLPLRTGAEREWLAQWNATSVDRPRERCLHQLIEDRTALTPDAVALTCGPRQLSYAALNERANRLAHLLRERGVGSEARVGVFLERSVDSVVALLAVLKAGGVYLPLDPGYPADRLVYMLGDSDVSVVLTTEDLLERLSAGPATVICLDRDARKIAAGSPADPAVDTHPEQLAYLIYTSGSTGRPKGAMMAHRGLANLITVEAGALSPDHESRVLQLASFSFDASLWDVVMSLPFGGTLCLATGEERLPGDDLARLMTEQAITHATLAPSALAVLPTAAAPYLRVLTSTGEALPPEVVDRWAAGRRLINGYGPTESTVGATAGQCHPGDQRPDLGTPFANTQVYVLDPLMQPTPSGVPGEVYIGGEGLSRGYLGRPGLTAERFVPDPFGTEPGGRLYRTGDRARFLADGRLVFQGRFDHQIKLRGFRIELGEVEAALREHPAVVEASVLPDQDGPTATRLVAYIAAAPGTTAGELRAHCAERLPDYMVPSAIMVLDALPHTPNGKLDRRALPAPDIDRPDEDSSYAPPRSADEETLAGIWAKLLGLARVGRDDNFFALGGDSIMSLQMVARAVEAGLPLSTKLVFQHGTVAELVAAVRPDEEPAPAKAEPLAFAQAGLDRAEVGRLAGQVPGLEDVYPLSPMQQGMLFHTLYAPESSVYRVQLTVRLEGPLDTKALRAAWEQLVERHTALRTTFHRTSQGQLVQVVHRTVPLPWTELDWHGPAEEELSARLADLEDRERGTAFDLAGAPLLRVVLVRVADEAYQLVWTMHHALLDGWSLPILLREVLALYEGVRGGGVVLPVVRPYREFVAWLGAQDSGVAEGVWRAALDGVVAPTVLPWDPPVVAEPGVASALVSVSDEVVGGLRELCRRQGVTLGTVVQAAWALLLGRHAGQQDVVFGATVSGRPAQLPGIESMVGLFINTLPVRVRLDGRAAVGPWLRELQSSLVELREFEHTPLTQIQGWSQVPRGTALFESLVVVENLPPGEADGGGDRVRVREVRVSDETDTPLTLVAAPGEGLQLRLLFQRERYDHDGARRLLDQLATVLAGFTAGDDRPLEEIRLLDEAGELERVRALNPGRAVFANAPAPVTSFTRRAAERPDAVALVWGERQFTYRAGQ
ncbi:non-ribosomal peptide synthetase, partial [Streptomyces sp. CB01881]|uniref:non-ribosomal peptide synthetase n=1 Tax=Streptomyces sp. CB01881 TaxID=2078691 RepID=UPI000CDC9583